MIYIVFISALVFLFGNDLIHRLNFSPDLILRGEVWRLITWIFVPINPGSNIFFMAITLYFYYFIGSTLEREWGTPKFSVYYLFGIVLHIIYGFAVWLILGRTVLMAPLFLNLSMFFAFAVLFPDHSVRLFFVIPIKIKWLALVNAAYFLLFMIIEIISGRFFIAILPIVALLNFIIICGDEALSYLRPIRARTSPQVIEFKRAAKKAKQKNAEQNYRHKCAVCGKTDTDFPDLEFRYCSRCEGYHCFCSEHINNHIHFK
ncbi:MAG: rhomboid family intramembrane serine protease [Oscillospiraceae bacterium]|nr:rhomboid family intramembrane serine protease [Oscillospiraceae bacterium]